MKSTKPFAETLRLVLAMVDLEDLSDRRLAARVQERGGIDRSFPTLHRIFSGSQPPILVGEEAHGRKPETLEAIARTLRVEPETFAEYRLWEMRRRFNPEAVGWRKAIRNLERAEEAGSSAPEKPHDPADLLDDDSASRDSDAARA